MQPKDTEERRRAIDRVNRAYADEDYDRYERLIERYNASSFLKGRSVLRSCEISCDFVSVSI